MNNEQIKSISFGLVTKYILFGGGYLLISSAIKLQKLGVQVFVVTSKRHSLQTLSIESEEKILCDWLDHNHIENIVSEDITNDEKVLSAISYQTIGLSFGAAWVFKKSFIELFNGKLLNFHGTKLPKNRGGGGFSWRIMQGDKTGNSLIHKVDEGLDTGEIVLEQGFIYPEKCKLPLDYSEYSLNQYTELIDIFFDKVKNFETFILTTQNEKSSSYWPRLSTDIHGFINWNWGLKDIERFICAFDKPYAGASTFINKTKVRLMDCQTSFTDGVFHPFQKGIIYRKNGKSLFVATEDGSIIVNQIFDFDNNDMMKNLAVGDRFYTPSEFLDHSMQYRAVYNSNGLSSPKP